MKYDNKIMQRRGEKIMGNTIVKVCLLSLVLFIGSVPALSQDMDDIKCGVASFDPNSSGGPTINKMGMFSVIADGEEMKDLEGVFLANKFYDVPRTKLILSVAVVYAPPTKYGLLEGFIIQMVLGKKKVSELFVGNNKEDSSGLLFVERRKLTKDVVGFAQTGYSTEAFEKEGEGVLSMAFSEKEQPIQIIMRCKKED